MLGFGQPVHFGDAGRAEADRDLFARGLPVNHVVYCATSGNSVVGSATWRWVMTDLQFFPGEDGSMTVLTPTGVTYAPPLPPEALAAEEKRIREILDQLPDGRIVIDGSASDERPS